MTDSDTDNSSPNWDDLSFQRPAAPAVDGTVAPGTDPAVAAAINRMNQGLSAGQSDDEILSNEVGDIGRTGRKVTATTTGDDSSSKKSKSDGAPSWDSLSFSKPAPQPTMNQPDKSLMTQPDDEDDLVRASGGEQGTEPQDTTQGPGIGSVIASNLRGAGLSVARAGELAAAGIDQYLSPEDAEKEFKNAQALRDYQKENEVAPVTKGEKAASFASNLVGGLATGGIGGPESEAQDVIEAGGSVKDAEKALAVGTAQQEAMLGTGNLGKTLGTRLATQVPINVGLGAAARAVDGQDAGDSGDIASDIGSGVFGALVPGGEHETKEVKAARKVNEASDQLIKNTETSNADEISQDQGGVSEAGTQPQSGGESRGEDLQQPAKAESGASDAQQQVTRADLVNRWQNAEGATAQRKAADDLAAYDATNKGDADVDQNIQPPSASGDAEKGASDAGTSAKDEGAPDAGETKPFTPEERSKEKTEAILDKVPGLSDEQKGYLRDNMPAPEKDSVTGYYTRPELKPTIDAAKDSGEPSAYAEVDLRNLGGLNAHVGSNSGADEHYTAMADIIRQEAEKSGAQVVPIRKGGDEMGLVFKGADANTAHQTMLNAQDRIADYATTNGLSDIANPKGGAKGTGIHFGVSDILPEHSTSDIIKRADTLVELRKKGETYEYPRPTEEVGTGERAAGRPGASTEASGVRDAGADGLADDHEQATQGQRSSAAESGAVNERAGESGAVEPEREAVPLYRTGTASEGVTAPEARDTLKKEFGSTAVRKMEAAGLKISPSSDLAKLSPELSPAERAGVKGVTAGGRPHLIHDQTSAAEIPGTVVHEIWHANADRVLPKTKQEALARAVDKVPGVQSALAKIPGSTNPAHVNAEKVAYALQHLHDNSVGTRALDAIKIGLNRLGVPKNWLDANESLLRRLGSENLKHFQETPRTYQDTGTQRAAKPRVKAPSSVWDSQRENAREPPKPEDRDTTNGPSPDAVGVKNEAKAAERATRGLEPEVSNLRPSEKQVWDSALEKRANNPTAGYELAADLAKKPRPISNEETALLIQHGAELNNKYDDAIDRINKAKASGDTNAEVNAQRDRKNIEEQLLLHDKAAKESGTEWSAAGRMRQKLAERDFSMARQLAKFKAISGGSLTDRLRGQVESGVRRIAELQKTIDAATQPRSTPRVPGARRTLDDDFAAMAKKAAAKLAAKAKPVPSEAMYARVADPELATLIRQMARNRSDAGETNHDSILGAIHDALGGGVAKKDIADTIATTAPRMQGTKTELEQRHADLKAALRDPAARKDKAAQDRIQKQINDVQRRIANKDYSAPVKKEKSEPSEAVQKMQVELAGEKRKLQAMAERQERINDSPVGKTMRLITDAKIFNILLSAGVYKKLAAAVVTRNATQTGEEAIGAILSHIPGISKYASYSPRYHGGEFWKGEGAAVKGLGSAFTRAKEDFLQGQNKWETLYGSKHLSGEFTDFAGQLGEAIRAPGLNKVTEVAHAASGYPGRTHAMIKEFVSEPEFNRSMVKLTAFERARQTAQGKTAEQVNEHMNKESTIATLQSSAYQHALESKFQGRNAFTDSVNIMLRQWEKSGDLGKLASGAAKVEFPIRGIPMNIAKELLTSYPFGAVKAALKMRGFDKLSEQEKNVAADYIMKNLRKQGMGAIILATSMAMQSNFGGVFGAEEKKKNPAVKAGEATLGGTNYSSQVMHGPAPELAQIGASLQRVYEKEYGKNHNAFLAGITALAQVGVHATLNSVPYFDQIQRQIETAQRAEKWDHRSGVGAVAGEMIRSNVVPAVVQQHARDIDTAKYRNPKNIAQDVEVGLPGKSFLGIPGREQVPTH